MMLITVVIPTYRRPALLLKCLAALTAQLFDADQFEVIIVTDGPDEITGSMFASWANPGSHKVKLLSLPSKKGPAAARNFGWLKAQGELIAFTDDDCLPETNWLQNFWNAYKQTASLEAAFTGETVVPISENPSDYELNVSHLQTADFITANCCCTKAALEMTGGFDEQFSMAWREDSDLEFKLLQNKIPVIKVNDAIVVHPVREAPWGISLKEQKKTMFNALLYKKYPQLYRQKIQPLSPVNYYIIITAFVAMLTACFLKWNWVATGAGIVWMGFTIGFVIQRLKKTRFTANHLLEMTATSFVIPFLSVYWQFYGALKYKVVLI